MKHFGFDVSLVYAPIKHVRVEAETLDKAEEKLCKFLGQDDVEGVHLGPAGKPEEPLPNLDALSGKLAELKESYPTKTDAAILLEQDIAYETVVRVMDTVRIAEAIEGDAIVRSDLFPDISIGDAPVGDEGA